MPKGKQRALMLSARGMATHAALHLVQDEHHTWRGSSRQLEEVLHHKAQAITQDSQGRHRQVRRYLIDQVKHRRWAAMCCKHLVAIFQAYGVTRIVAVEQRLPHVEAQGGLLVDTGEIDIIAYSNTLQGCVAFEVKTRFDQAQTRMQWKKAVRNALGTQKWLTQHDHPELVEVVWVFFVPHAHHAQVPIMVEQAMHYTPEKAQAAFANWYGGLAYPV